MQIRVMIILLFSLVLAVFAVINTQPVEINFFFTKAEIELIFVIIFSLIIGAFLMFILSSMKQLQQSRRIKNLGKENIKIKADLEQLKSQQLKNEEQVNKSNIEVEKKNEQQEG